MNRFVNIRKLTSMSIVLETSETSALCLWNQLNRCCILVAPMVTRMNGTLSFSVYMVSRSVFVRRFEFIEVSSMMLLRMGPMQGV